MNEVQKLIQANAFWSNVKCSEQTRYGILSAIYTSSNSTQMNCNFSFGTGVAVVNTEVINSLFAAQPVGEFDFKRKMIAYLKNVD